VEKKSQFQMQHRKIFKVEPNMNFIILFLILSFQNAWCASDAIVIRSIVQEDVQPLLALDREITHEFFTPVFEKTYELLGIDRDAQRDLEEELSFDEESFSDCVNSAGDERLYIAYDQMQHTYCGFIMYHKVDRQSVEIDLLMVDKLYRNKGIGKKLVRSIFQAFDGIKSCVVYPLQFFNESTLIFYESLGFINCGVGPHDKINTHDIKYSDLYFHYQLAGIRSPRVAIEQSAVKTRKGR
jgi:GNAT superfamily N-acetyltransferase